MQEWLCGRVRIEITAFAPKQHVSETGCGVQHRGAKALEVFGAEQKKGKNGAQANRKKERRQYPSRSSHVEIGKAKSFRRRYLVHDDTADQKPADDEEDINSNEATAKGA